MYLYGCSHVGYYAISPCVGFLQLSVSMILGNAKAFSSWDGQQANPTLFIFLHFNLHFGWNRDSY